MSNLHHPHPKVRRRELDAEVIRRIVAGEAFGSCPRCSNLLALDHRLVCGAQARTIVYPRGKYVARDGHVRVCNNCQIIWVLEVGAIQPSVIGARKARQVWPLNLKAIAACACRERLDEGSRSGYVLAKFPGKPPRRLRLAVE